MSGGVALARAVKQGEDCRVAEDERVQGTLFVFCQNLHIAGVVEGNLIGIGLRTSIVGEVGENVYLAGLELASSGAVQGDLHFLGLILELAGDGSAAQSPVRGQVVFAALSFALEAKTQLGGQLTGFGYQALIDGDVHGEVNYMGSALVINSRIQGDVYATVGNPETDVKDVETLLLPLGIEFAGAAPGLSVTNQGVVDGDLQYMGPAEAAIEGQVVGEIQYISRDPAFTPELPQQRLATLFYEQYQHEFAVLLTVGILGLALAGSRFRYPLRQMRRRPAHSFVIGMLLFIISFPITLILLMVTLVIILLLLALNLDGVALPVGALLTLVDVCLVGSFYFCAIFVARAVFALGLGRMVLHGFSGAAAARRKPRLSIVIGVALLALLTSLPVVGFVFNASALFLGLGAIASTVAGWAHAARRGHVGARPRAVAQVASGLDQPQAASAARPARKAQSLLLPANPGLEDLPAGFDPDFFFSDD